MAEMKLSVVEKTGGECQVPGCHREAAIEAEDKLSGQKLKFCAECSKCAENDGRSPRVIRTMGLLVSILENEAETARAAEAK